MGAISVHFCWQIQLSQPSNGINPSFLVSLTSVAIVTIQHPYSLIHHHQGNILTFLDTNWQDAQLLGWFQVR